MRFIFFLNAAIALAQSGGTFTATSYMNSPRIGPTATLLQSGKVLVAGGATATAELYDPSAESFTRTGDMVKSRRFHTATLLPDGRVLIVGGFVGDSNNNTPTASAEIYDPSAGTFTALDDVRRSTLQAIHTATLLNNGEVLIAGIGPNARIFNPADSTFRDAGSYIDPAPWAVSIAALLPDGRVLIAGCTDACNAGFAQLYDPVTDSFSATGGASLFCRSACWFNAVDSATLLADGNVLIAGSDEGAQPSIADVYDRSSGIFTLIGNGTGPHEYSTSTLLPDGTVMIAGSELPGGSADAGVDIYDPATGKFAFAGKMISSRYAHTATLLPDGRVLLAGGNYSSAAEIYKPKVLVPSPVLYSLPGETQGAVWHSTTGEIAASSNPAVGGEVLSMYTNNLIEGGVIAPQVSVGGRSAEVLYFGDAPGFPGTFQVNFRVPNAVAPGTGLAVRLRYLERPSNEVTIATR